jgi:transcriptional regulator with XRE-family HTH domain
MNYEELKVGFKIRKMRELKNMTRKEVASLLSMTERSYSDIENENINITLKKLCEICTVFDCNICDLLEFSGSKMFSFYVNNNGNQGHNINHQGATNETQLIESLLRTKDELIQSKNSIIQKLEQQLSVLTNKKI